MERRLKWQYLRMEINVPELSLVVLIGTSGSGKSSFAKKHFKKSEILSSDECRALVSDDENNQAATNDAFDVLYYIARKRLQNGLLTVIDATNVERESRKGLIELSRDYHCLPVAIILDTPNKVCEERNQNRNGKNFGSHVIHRQKRQLKSSIKSLKGEGFRNIYILKSVEEIDSVTAIIREKLYNDKKDISGPFDIIGDIHGCFEELQELLIKLGYSILKGKDDEKEYGFQVVSSNNRKVIFLGDLVDRGPDSPSVLRLVMSMVHAGIAYCVPGNHDLKLQKFLIGKKVQLKHGLEVTVEQLKNESDRFKKNVEQFLYGLISHYVFDNGKLVVAHAGLKEEMQGRGSGAVRSFCLYGETTGEIDEFGLPVRLNWAKEYRGKAKVVYGHTPVPEAEWLNKTIDIDTGCVFGGKLTALRYPEEELVSIQAKKTYCEPVKPLHSVENVHGLSAQQENDDLLNIEDVIGKRIIQTKLKSNIVIREENSIAALEVMSRFAVNPKWLIYLPPTMSPCETSKLPDYLEHPEEALNYYQKRGIEKVVCEEKHMGSRAIVVICKDEDSALKRFGIKNEGIGICYTRTGRNFFNDEVIETQFITRINQCLTNIDFWNNFNTDWVCLDAELMPWSAKASALLRDQYAALGAAATGAFPEVEEALKQTMEREILGIAELHERYSKKQTAISKYVTAYQNYCWPIQSIDDYKLAPFHILATEGQVHIDKSHEWHMEKITEICGGDKKLFLLTPYQVVDLNNRLSFDEAIRWWIELTQKGGEGIVVKPYDFIEFGKKGLLQPAVKCRGSEYLRIIYGPEYDLPENIERLKKRGLSRKQSLALREFALGVEGLERFVKKEPLRRVHESVFGVLALESEEVDPRL
ncbi:MULTISPECIES: polynucleotide kinase-phosphatase [unclassified Leptospira]|uniref:polynucleotide kinase-phosphatase n=1 Tax=unclassified Leptospira TaxID=2633828 RepID=UPI0002929BED|nr:MULTISPECIES: polynucleotide kinase-phosphatase [unclassified Leptospira]EKO76905.1 polynucleotide kinase-phosphatase [Leptospira sp. Fiocruz LV3954]EMI67204.1 polynucleotide kinase-phosphatase [Leptospira sp. Fiocruz LV4135]